MPSIAQKNIVVIGGSSGIGAAVAGLVAEQNANVFIASSNPARIDAAIEKIRKNVPDAKIQGLVCDIGNDDAESQLDSLFSKISAEVQIHHVVYTAVRFNPVPLEAATLEHLRRSGHWHVHVPVLIAKLAPKYLEKSSTSSLVFTGGLLSEKPLKGYVSLIAGFASINATVRALALELAPIRVNMVCPGATDTELLGERRAEFRELVAKRLLLGKIALPEEVAEAYVYLLKDSSNTGSCVNTNGGEMLQ